MMEPPSLSSVDTEYSADAIEWCPGKPHLFACGTYQVVKGEEEQPIVPPGTEQRNEDEEEDQEGDEGEGESSSSPTVTRYGRCLLYEVDSEGKNLCVDFPPPFTAARQSLTRVSTSRQEKQRFDGPAILDMKWSPRLWNEKTTLAIADAKGHVQLHGLDSETVSRGPAPSPWHAC